MENIEPKKVKRQRKPIGVQNRMEVINQDPNRVYRLINNDPSRLRQFELAGYKVEEVKDMMPGAKPGTKGTNVDNVFHAGSGQQQVLVSIEKEFFDEDQAVKQAKIDAVEAQMKNKTGDGLQGFYGDIKVTR